MHRKLQKSYSKEEIDGDHAVTLRIYRFNSKSIDSFGIVSWFSSWIFWNISMDEICHTSVVVHGIEWGYGLYGIGCRDPGSSHSDRSSIAQNRTNINLSDFLEYLDNLEDNGFAAHDYHVMKNNCNHFSQKVLAFLCSEPSGIPEDIINLPEKYMQSYAFRGISGIVGIDGINHALLSMYAYYPKIFS